MSHFTHQQDARAAAKRAKTQRHEATATILAFFGFVAFVLSVIAVKLGIVLFVLYLAWKLVMHIVG